MKNKVTVYNQRYTIFTPHQLRLWRSHQRVCDGLDMWVVVKKNANKILARKLTRRKTTSKTEVETGGQY